LKIYNDKDVENMLEQDHVRGFSSFDFRYGMCD